MKYTKEEADFAVNANELEIDFINTRLEELEEEKQGYLSKRIRLENQITDIKANTEPQISKEESRRLFHDLVVLWDNQPEENKDKFFDEVFFSRLGV